MENIFEEWLYQYFDEVEPVEFYRDLFPAGELQTKGDYTKGKYNALIVAVTKEKKKDGKPRIKRYTMTDDLEILEQLQQSDDFCLCSPLTYAGKERSAKNARFAYAIAVDLDKIRTKDGQPVGLIDLWNGHIMRAERIPKPTYIVSSGTGLHLYYVFDQAVALFQDTAKQLQDYKRELTELIWNEGIVDIKDQREIQQEGIYQGFRMPGTITKGGARARAFLTGEKVTLDYMNQFARKHPVDRFAYKHNLSLAEAAEKYPDWYERRIKNKEPRGVWHISRNVYDWWKREILAGARVGHRYNCLMTLAIYARKCSMYDEKHNPNPVTYEELEADCYEIMDYFESLTDSEDNHFTTGDVMDALEAFEERWLTYPRNSVEYKSGIPIPANKRNGQKQEWHLEEARSIRDIRMRRQGRKWTDGNGRKPKGDIVEQWQQAHPEGRKADCIRDTGLDKKTVYKYWK